MVMQSNPYYTEVPVGYYTQQQRGQQQPQQGTGYQVGNTAGKVAGAYGAKYIGGQLLGDGTSGIGPVASGADYAASLGAQQGTGTTGSLASPTGVSATRVGSTAASSQGGTAGTLSAGNVAGGTLGAVGLGYGGYQGYQGIKKGDSLQAGIGGMGAGMGGAALASSLGAFGAGGIAGAGASSLSSLAALGPYGLVAAAAMAAAAYGQKMRWGKGDKDLEVIRRQFTQKRMNELGLLDQNVGGIEGRTGFDLGDGKYIHVGEGEDEGSRIAMTPDGVLNPDVYMNAIDTQRLQDAKDQGWHTGNLIDWTAPDAGINVAAANPLSYLIMGGNGEGNMSQIANAYLANALGSTKEDSNLLTTIYDRAGYGDETGADRMIADIGALSNSGQLSQWEALAAQNEINRQYGLAGYSPMQEIDTSLKVDPAHQAAFDAYNAEQEKIRALG